LVEETDFTPGSQGHARLIHEIRLNSIGSEVRNPDAIIVRTDGDAVGMRSLLPFRRAATTGVENFGNEPFESAGLVEPVSAHIARTIVRSEQKATRGIQSEMASGAAPRINTLDHSQLVSLPLQAYDKFTFPSPKIRRVIRKNLCSGNTP
jgi:hypothetical protein